MPRYTLKYENMSWYLIDSETESKRGKILSSHMLGNARGIQTYRDGLEVLITSDTYGCKDEIIPSDTLVKGFALSQNDKSLYDLMDVGVVYNCCLRPIT